MMNRDRLHSQPLILVILLAAVFSGRAAEPAAAAEETDTFCTSPTIEQFLQEDGRIRVIAHRGFSARAPENTVSSILEAVNIKADMAEIDVSLTADAVVVCLHDEKVNRTTNGKGRISDMTLAEAQRLDAGSWFSSRFKGERIPTLDAVLEAAKGRILVNIEIKPETVEFGIAGKVVDAVKRHTMQDMVLISSFSPEALAQVHALEPAIQTASLYNRKIHRGVDPLVLVNEVNSSMLNINSHYLKRDFLERCIELGIPVGVYTANSRGKMKRLIAKGVHAIFTNHPDVLLELLAKNTAVTGQDSTR